MGGALALAAMADGASIDAGAPFYGIPDGRYFDVTKIKAPICAQFGDLDKHKGFADPGAAQVSLARHAVLSRCNKPDLAFSPCGIHVNNRKLVNFQAFTSISKWNQGIPDHAEI